MLPNIGVVGRQRAGKDTIAAHLVESYGYVRVGLADAVKEMALVLDPIVHAEVGNIYPTPSVWTERLSEIVEKLGWERAKDDYPAVRLMLQRLGTDVVRNNFGEDAWVNILLRKVVEQNRAGKPVVVPDVRFPNEGDAVFRRARGILFRVSRPAAAVEDAHESERYANLIPVQHEILNDASILALRVRVDAIMAEAAVRG